MSVRSSGSCGEQTGQIVPSIKLGFQAHHDQLYPHWWSKITTFHDDIVKWKHFGHRSPVNSPHKGQWRGALMFSLICAWTDSLVNNRDTSDLRYHRTHYGNTVMLIFIRGILILVRWYIYIEIVSTGTIWKKLFRNDINLANQTVLKGDVYTKGVERAQPWLMIMIRFQYTIGYWR